MTAPSQPGAREEMERDAKDWWDLAVKYTESADFWVCRGRINRAASCREMAQEAAAEAVKIERQLARMVD